MTDEKMRNETHGVLEFENGNEFLKYHINNMVGVRLTPKYSPLKKTFYYKQLEVIERVLAKRSHSRILLDLFAVTINPKIPKNGWQLTNTELNFKNYIAANKGFEIVETQRLHWKPMGALETVLYDDLIEHFKETFKGLLEFEDEVIDIGGGEGFNAGKRYTIKDTSGTIQFRYFDPKQADESKTYASGSPEDNYVRQKINMKLTGDGLQVLRNKGILVQFILKLYKTYECSATMFDIACDFFNYGLKPKEFLNLYDQDYYIGRSKVNAMGDSKNPTAYIGKYKGSRTIMMYDKLQEGKDNEKADEPELVEQLDKVGGDWFRLEQHYSADQKEAKQAFDYLVIDLVKKAKEYSVADVDLVERLFCESLASLLYVHVEKKCRFLRKPRKERNNDRILTHPIWELVLDVIKDTDCDFAFERPVLSIEERMANYKYRSLGGNNLLKEIWREYGPDELKDFLMEVHSHVAELVEREDKENAEKEDKKETA